MTRTILTVACCLSLAAGLSSCASTGDPGVRDMQSSFSVNGMSYQGGTNLRDPRFYEDDDQGMAPFARDPRCC